MPWASFNPTMLLHSTKWPDFSCPWSIHIRMHWIGFYNISKKPSPSAFNFTKQLIFIFVISLILILQAILTTARVVPIIYLFIYFLTNGANSCTSQCQPCTTNSITTAKRFGCLRQPKKQYGYLVSYRVLQYCNSYQLLFCVITKKQ